MKNSLILWIYRQNEIPEELEIDAAMLVLNERLVTATNIILSLDREIERLNKVEAEFAAYKAEQEQAKAKRLLLLKDLL